VAVLPGRVRCSLLFCTLKRFVNDVLGDPHLVEGWGCPDKKKNQYKPGKKAKQKNINISFTGSPIFKNNIEFLLLQEKTV
jgi:hypothetical protein